MLLNHSWDLDPTEAVQLQKELSKQIRLQKLDNPPQYIGGADISFNKYSDTVYAGIIVLRYPELIEVCRATIVAETKFPYIPGLLAFREIPALLDVWEKLEIKPDIMVLDGQGILHPRRMGIASHFGLATGVPSLGCAKSMLAFKYQEPGNNVGDMTIIKDKSEQIGIALRTKKNVQPVYISPGHKITMEESIEIIQKCLTGYRIPEPTRRAHLLVNSVRIANMPGQGQTTLF